MGLLEPEQYATKWNLNAGYNPDSDAVEAIQMEDTTKSLNVANYVWDTTTLAWVKSVQAVLVTDSIYLAVDDLETLIAATNALLTTIDADTSIMAADTPLMVTSLGIMEDWDESDRAKVNLIAGQAGIAAGAGAVAANTPRVTLASDDPLLVEVQDSLDDYFLDDFDTSGDTHYLGYQDKTGNYYIQRIIVASGSVDYNNDNTTSYADAWTNRATEGYADFASTF